MVTDGVFSMNGDVAPLDEIYEVTRGYDVILMVDDAHGEGVLGERGRGFRHVNWFPDRTQGFGPHQGHDISCPLQGRSGPGPQYL